MISDVVPEQIAELKTQPGGDIPDVRMSLGMKGTRPFGNGVVLLHYPCDGAAASAECRPSAQGQLVSGLRDSARG